VHNLDIGDLIFAKIQKSYIHHTFIVTTTVGELRVSAHNTDHRNTPWTDILKAIKDQGNKGQFYPVKIVNTSSENNSPPPMPFQTRRYGNDISSMKWMLSAGNAANQGKYFFDPRMYYALGHSNNKFKKLLDYYVRQGLKPVPTSLWQHFANPNLWAPSNDYGIIGGDATRPDSVVRAQSAKSYQQKVSEYLSDGGKKECVDQAKKVTLEWLDFECGSSGEEEKKEMTYRICEISKTPGKKLIKARIDGKPIWNGSQSMKFCDSGYKSFKYPIASGNHLYTFENSSSSSTQVQFKAQLIAPDGHLIRTLTHSLKPGAKDKYSFKIKK